ncbi:MAG: hypothetical protein R3F65_27600 [bacterium]
MTVGELLARIDSGPVSVTFDTNFLRARASFASLSRVSQKIRQANSVLAPNATEPPIQIRISALVHEERVYQLRRQRAKLGLPFRSEVIDEFLEQLGFKIEEFTRADAEGSAEHLFARFADDASWKAAKKSKGSKSATIDWLIAGHAVTRKWLVVTNDGGPEWTGVAKVSRSVWDEALDYIVGTTFAPTM